MAGAALPVAMADPLHETGAWRMTSFTNTRIEALCEAETPAFAVFVEQYHAGWRAEVDQRPAPIERANLIARAVRLSLGAHRVGHELHATGRAAGFAASGLDVLGLGCCFLSFRGRRPVDRQGHEANA